MKVFEWGMGILGLVLVVMIVIGIGVMIYALGMAFPGMRVFPDHWYR